MAVDIFGHSADMDALMALRAQAWAVTDRG